MVLALLCTLAVQAAVVPADAAFPGDNGRLVFQRDRGLVSVKATGSGVRQLAGPDAFFPSWSPNGRKIVFVRQVKDSVEGRVVVMNADGSNERRLTPLGRWSFPRFSPNGRKVVVGQYHTGNGVGRLVVMNARTGKNRHDLAPRVKGTMSHPQWLGNGRIAYLYSEHMWTIAADGRLGSAKQLWPAPNRLVDWSPDGKKVVFARTNYQEGTTITESVTIHVMSASGRNVRKVADYGDRYWAETPVWSPDGKRIAFTVVNRGLSGQLPELVVMDADGSNKKTIAQNATLPSWQPRP